EAGALAGLLPGGRPMTDPDARSQLAAVWGELPAPSGRDTTAILAAAAAGELGALLVGGVEPADLADPAAALAALDAVGFLVSLELRHSEVTDRADVVFPVAPAVEKAGTFVNWEGRSRRFGAALADTGALPDLRVLDTIAEEMGTPLGLGGAADAHAELQALGGWAGPRAASPTVAAGAAPAPGRGEAVLASWRMLLDAGRMQDGEPNLAGTARTPVVRLGAATADEIGAADGDPVTVATDAGAITLPLVVTVMPERVVWLPMNSPGSAVHRGLGVTAGATVQIHTGEERAR
ncbi:molybdopterin dinucleotide binding domain-containing protein, partial [Mycolicibacillus trivialis]